VHAEAPELRAGVHHLLRRAGFGGLTLAPQHVEQVCRQSLVAPPLARPQELLPEPLGCINRLSVLGLRLDDLGVVSQRLRLLPEPVVCHCPAEQGFHVLRQKLKAAICVAECPLPLLEVQPALAAV